MKNVKKFESFGDNGDEEAEKYISIENKLFGLEGSAEEFRERLSVAEMIEAGIEIYDKSDVSSGLISRVLSNQISQKLGV